MPQFCGFGLEMCGIAGIRRFDGRRVEDALLARMASEMNHRGPDSARVWSKDSVGFSHARLSIIDLTGSAQPMSNPGEDLHLVFNGEILNYRELRRKLTYPFKTDGDTEVLLALYSKYGADGVEYLNGQFSYAIHDSKTRETHLFRDRMGILPLYYFANATLFAFASEIKALLPLLGSARLDQDSLHDYLAHRAVPSPHTLIDGVKKVPPGHHLLVKPDGTLALREYWSLREDVSVGATQDSAAIRLVDDALSSSVRSALVADVPVGVYLSGGLDSSLITSMVRRHQPNNVLQTFSASFGDPRHDESEWARKVAGLVGSDHHEVLVSPEDFLANWAKLSWNRDGPLSEPADIAVYRLAERAAQSVKVVLSGEGSDELFGGYPKYLYANATRWFGVVPFSGLLGRLEHHLPIEGDRIRIALRAVSQTGSAERMRGWFAPFTVDERELLIGRGAPRAIPASYVAGWGDNLTRMLYADTSAWLADNLLERADRMSMAASVETRPPFLDHRLVELAFALPSRMKVRGRTTKWVIKQVARKYLPDDVVDRSKVGFKVPLDQWFRGGLRDMAFDLLTGPSSFVGSAFNGAMVSKLLDDHSAVRRNEESRLWTLLSLEVWYRELVRRAHFSHCVG